jgi:pyruvate ferredoxin oxidoreductase alpha subunit
MSKKKILDGNHAAAEAMRQINPEVVPAYPITPTSYIMEHYATFVNNGKVQTELITVESEHAAMSACVGASAAGGRVMTATSSQGLKLMSEVLWNASGLRLPIVLINGNRSLGAPLSIHCDHSDSMAERDSGWIQLYAQNAQEMYDLLLQSFLISEHEDVRLPIMINMDAFQVTHTHQEVIIEDDEKVKEFIGKAKLQKPLLDIDNPVSYGGATRPDYYQEFRRNQLQGMLNAYKVIEEIGEKFKEKFGRGSYDEFGKDYKLEDSEYVFIVMGSTEGTVNQAIDTMRKNGVKAGSLRLRLFRPFPSEYIRQLLKNAKTVIVMDRTSPAGGNGGPVFLEVRSALYDLKLDIHIIPFIYGLGSKDFNVNNVHEMLEIVKKIENNEKEVFSEESIWIG